MLAEAGILQERIVTTHWQLYEAFEQNYPGTTLDTKRMLVHDGNIITSGAGMSQMDLMLYIVRDCMGNQIAESIMRYLLIDDRPAQYHYMALSNLQTDNREVLMLEKFIEDCLPEVPSLKAIAEHLAITEKPCPAGFAMPQENRPWRSSRKFACSMSRACWKPLI